MLEKVIIQDRYLIEYNEHQRKGKKIVTVEKKIFRLQIMVRTSFSA